MYKATQDNDIIFNHFAKKIIAEFSISKIYSGCKKEVEANDIVKGFRYSDSDDDYIIITDDDFEKAKNEKDRGMHHMH